MNAAATAPEPTSSGAAPTRLSRHRATARPTRPLGRPRRATAKNVTETAPKATTPMKVPRLARLPVAPEDVAPAISSTRAHMDRPPRGRDASGSSAATATPARVSEGGVAFHLDRVIDTGVVARVQRDERRPRGASMIFTAIYWFARYAAGFGAGPTRGARKRRSPHAGRLAMAGTEEDAPAGNGPQRGGDRARGGRRAVPDMHTHGSTPRVRPQAVRRRRAGRRPSSVRVTKPPADSPTKSARGVAPGSRARAWCDKNGVDLKDCVFYTDSMSDVLLMEHVGTPVAVNPDARLRRVAEERGWRIEDWGIAEARARKPRYSYGCLNFGGSAVGPG